MAPKSRRRKPKGRRTAPKDPGRDRYTAGELFLAALGALFLLLFLGMLVTSLL